MTVRRMINGDGDYVPQAGGFAEDVGMTSRVVWLLRLQRGSCPVAPGVGNPFLAPGTKLGSDAARRAEQDARRALSPLTDRGLIWDVEVGASELGAGSVELEVAFRDATSGERPRTVRTRLGA